MTFSVPPEVKAMAQKRDEVNWSGFVAGEIERYVEELEGMDRWRRRRGRLDPELVEALAEAHHCEAEVRAHKVHITAGGTRDRLRLAWALEERFGADALA